MPINVLDKISINQRENEKAALCVVVSSKGSTPRKVGAKMIVYKSGKIIGTIGGGNLEKIVIENALIQLEKNEAKLFKHDLLQNHNMCCGGVMDIYIEPIMKIDKLIIFGAGHTGAALAKFAKELNFEITIIDDRKEAMKTFENESFSLVLGPYEDQLKNINFDNNTYIVILTYDHAYDRAILSYCLHQPFAYLGMIGSKRKIKLTKKLFVESEMARASELEKVDMPMGFDINAITPEEIAISILAKVISIKNKSI